MQDTGIVPVRVIPPGVSGKDYVLQIKVKNGPLLRTMRARGFSSAAALARAANVNNSVVGEYLALKRVPINRTTGQWTPGIQRIAKVLGCLPEMLFPEQHVSRALPKQSVEAEVSLDEVERLQGGLLLVDQSTPEDAFVATEMRSVIDGLLAELPSRTRAVISMRYGLDGEGAHTLDDCAKRFGLSRQRIRDIEGRALRTLQHRSRKAKLIEAGYVPH